MEAAQLLEEGEEEWCSRWEEWLGAVQSCSSMEPPPLLLLLLFTAMAVPAAWTGTRPGQASLRGSRGEELW